MPSVWIEEYRHVGKSEKRKRGRGVSFRVRYTLGGRASVPLWGGAFLTKKEAEARKEWIRGEIAARRVPQLELLAPAPTITLRAVAEAWRKSRIDVSDGTRATHAVNLGRILPTLGERQPAAITKGHVQELVAKLAGEGLARESIRKTIATLAMVLDHA